MRTARYVILALLALVVAGCGSGTGTAAPVVTVTQTAPGTTKATGKPAKSSKPASRKTLPDVVGMNLQAAQDHLQAKGFYVLNDKDATGANRFQVSDRNWVVVRQTPVAGRKVATDALVTLWAKKYGE